ncbi:MAG: SulP family inorganic anion transporter [Deltaproteobacteria bacterium]|nr:SulP family inorganic anion transporter [Deltaproteobacteria bacterium]MBW2214506.1 SulP family inorganic anion transporter [Deltaproteobacteria bacterium]MBW2628122.1 SulP family inorganic anion transporter [Deltaproteobacteria bacterium]MBW2685481.1 SulP family inorganic anion transporter [Deltaproteobacteria bacterium]
MKSPSRFSRTLQSDLPASLVVFLVALPLCLGIALASGAPLISGLIAGIVGGIVVGSLSGSPLGVSGPAAGLAVIVLMAIQDLGAFNIFLVAVILAGLIQIGLGFLRAGTVAYYFPSSVISGMLAGIGIIIFLKQIPHAFGYDADPVGELSFWQPDGENTFSELLVVVHSISPGPLIIASLSLAILLLWESRWFKTRKLFTLVPGPLVAVVIGVLLNLLFRSKLGFTLTPQQVVSIPEADSLSGLVGFLTFPDFSALRNIDVYKTAVVLAIVASLETLLSAEAADKLDALKRVTPTNRELKAQGVGNIVSGLLGGLPVTQVIVRSSANIQSGARSKASTVIHGLLLAVSVLALPTLMNLIPLATLAAILFVVGFKLAKPSVFRKMLRQGPDQFIPFIVTIGGIVFTDLLVGIALGMVVAVLVILFENFRLPFEISNVPQERGERVQIALAQQVTFLNKASVLKTLDSIPDDSSVEIDASESVFVHPDVVELIDNFVIGAEAKNIEVVVHGLDHRPHVRRPTGMKVAVTSPSSLRRERQHENPDQRDTDNVDTPEGPRTVEGGERSLPSESQG